MYRPITSRPTLPLPPLCGWRSDDCTLSAWRLDAAALERNERPVRAQRFVGHADVVLDLLFLPNLNCVCSASLDRTIGMWCVPCVLFVVVVVVIVRVVVVV